MGGRGEPRQEPRATRKLERRILEELIYERVRLAVDLCELTAFAGDLSASVTRALARCSRSAEEQAALSRRYVERAWRRLGEELTAGRLDELPEDGDLAAWWAAGDEPDGHAADGAVLGRP